MSSGLVIGNNLLALELHQNSLTSSKFVRMIGRARSDHGHVLEDVSDVRIAHINIGECGAGNVRDGSIPIDGALD